MGAAGDVGLVTRPVVDGLRRLVEHRVVLSLDDGRVVDGQLAGLDGEWLVCEQTTVAVGQDSLTVHGCLFVARGRVLTIQVT